MKLFRIMMDEVTGHWRMFHIKKILDSYSLHGIIRVVKSRRLPWHEYVCRKNVYVGF